MFCTAEARPLKALVTIVALLKLSILCRKFPLLLYLCRKFS